MERTLYLVHCVKTLNSRDQVPKGTKVADCYGTARELLDAGTPVIDASGIFPVGWTSLTFTAQ